MNKSIFLFLLFLYLVFGLNAQDSDTPLQRIEWTGNPSARGYLVVFYREGTEVFRRETPDTWLTFSLPPGIYSWNVTIINKFGKEGGQSVTQELIIEKIQKPLVKRGIPSEVWSDEKNIEMMVEMYQLHDKGEIFLVQGEHRVKGDIVFRSEDRIMVKFDLTGFLPGFCALDLQNPAGVSSFAPKILRIKEKLTPVLTEVIPGFLYSGSLYTDVVLTGTGFEKGMTASFSDGTKIIEPAQVEVVSETEARVWLDLRNTPRGKYALRLENPSGTVSSAAEPVLIVDYTEEYYWKERNFGSDLLVGGVCFVVPDMGDRSNQIAFIPGVSARIDIDFTDRNPFVRNWSFEVRGDYAWIPSADLQAALMLSLAVVFRTRFNSNVNFFCKGGLGGQMTFGQNAENGPLFLLSGGIDLNFFLHFIVQLEAGYYLFINEGGSSSIFPLGINIGYRF